MLRGLEERLRLALEGTETGFWEWDVATDTVEWSDNMGPLYGLPRGTQPDGVADFLDRIVHPEDRERIATHHRDRRARRDGVRVRPARRPPGPGRALAAHARPGARRRRRPRGAHHRPALRRHRAPLPRGGARVPRHGVSQRLAASMDPVRTLEEVAELAVPRLADWCAVQLATDTVTGAFEQVAVAHADPDKVRWARELQQRYPPDPDSPTGAPAVIRSGRSELYPEIDQAVLEAAALDEEQIRLVRELQMHSVMIVPMTVRERTVGAITFVWAESGRQLRGPRPRAGRGARPPRRARARPRAAVHARTSHRGAAPARAAARTPAGAARLRARGALRPQRRARPRGRRLVRRVPAPGRPGRDRDRRRRRARAGGGRDDGPDPQRVARLRAQGRVPGRGDRRPARARGPDAAARSRSSPSSTSCSTSPPAAARSRPPATCRR